MEEPLQLPPSHSWTGRVALLVPPPDGGLGSALAPVRPASGGAPSRVWLAGAGTATLSLCSSCPRGGGSVAARFGLGGRDIVTCWVAGPSSGGCACWARGRVVSFTCPDPARPGKQRVIAFRHDHAGGARDTLAAAHRLGQRAEMPSDAPAPILGDGEIRGWIERTLLDPSFQAYVAEVERVWQEVCEDLEPWMAGSDG